MKSERKNKNTKPLPGLTASRAKYLEEFMSREIHLATEMEKRGVPITYEAHIGLLCMIEDAITKVKYADDDELERMLNELALKDEELALKNAKLSRKNKAGRPSGITKTTTPRQKWFNKFRKEGGRTYDEYEDFCNRNEVDDNDRYTYYSFEKGKNK